MTTLLYIVFFISSALLILVVLLQEGKGGGLSDAFGGAGAETFGVRAGGINKFTFGLFAVFVLSAMSLHWTSAGSQDEGTVGGAIAESSNAPPPGGGEQ
ncbi:MAG TPA: preprotein translocase subunit SecG [Planctomycetes bacterium]|nr:preprotein translocase subunit SecG [Planctomycetota bacterium]|tara:strand:- start:232 stop:528 length:297 start_codon:yes stop_codon:yes gene_type:complete